MVWKLVYQSLMYCISTQQCILDNGVGWKGRRKFKREWLIKEVQREMKRERRKKREKTERKKVHQSWFQHQSSWWDFHPGFRDSPTDKLISADSTTSVWPMSCAGFCGFCLNLEGYPFMERFLHPKVRFVLSL